MEFKEFVMQETNAKHADMLCGSTINPFSDMPKIISHEAYELKRAELHERLIEEKEKYNNALRRIISTKERRIKAEASLNARLRKAKRGDIACRAIALAGICIMLLVAFVMLRNGGRIWVNDSLIPAMGFNNFFDPTGVGKVAFIISAVLGGIIAIVMLIGVVMNGTDTDGFIGALIGCAILAVLAFLAVRLIHVGIGYLISLLISQYAIIIVGLASAVAILIINKKTAIKAIRLELFIHIAALAVVMIVCFCFGNEYAKESYLIIKNV